MAGSCLEIGCSQAEVVHIPVVDVLHKSKQQVDHLCRSEARLEAPSGNASTCTGLSRQHSIESANSDLRSPRDLQEMMPPPARWGLTRWAEEIPKCWEPCLVGTAGQTKRVPFAQKLFVASLRGLDAEELDLHSLQEQLGPTSAHSTKAEVLYPWPDGNVSGPAAPSSGRYSAATNAFLQRRYAARPRAMEEMGLVS